MNLNDVMYYSKCTYDCKLGCNVKHALLLYWGLYSHILMRGFQCASFLPDLNIGNEAFIYIYIYATPFGQALYWKAQNYCELGTWTWEESHAYVDMKFLATIKSWCLPVLVGRWDTASQMYNNMPWTKVCSKTWGLKCYHFLELLVGYETHE